ncbi:MAG: RidA family protein [Opitutales bacterium]|nr:RidA family protein [Opitutales bacterium]
MSIEARLSGLNIELPPAPPRGGVYQPVLTVGNQAFFSGHGPYQSDGTYICGKVGADIDIAAGQVAARQTGLAILASMKAHLGSLDRIKRVIKLLGMVDCPPDFKQHPQVINGCSELYRDIFGEEAGVGVRSAVGMGSLPGGMAVEIEGVFEIE